MALPTTMFSWKERLLMSLIAMEHLSTPVCAPQDPSTFSENVVVLQMLEKLGHVVVQVNCCVSSEKRMEVKNGFGFIISTWKMDSAAFN